jgi:hypothetical protein
MEMYARGGGGGVSLSVNKRLASEKTRKILDWTPTRYDILEDAEPGLQYNSTLGCRRLKRTSPRSGQKRAASCVFLRKVL